MSGPKWLPVTRDGDFWELVDDGKWLGGALRSQEGRYLGSKKCCRQDRFFGSMSEAARFVETTLKCAPCGAETFEHERRAN